MGYRLVRRLARLLLDLFYRRIEVVGLERVPLAGPLIVAANHQNALVDPMLLIAAVPRLLRPLAKAPLFRHPLIGPFLRLAGALPIYRRQDADPETACDRGRNLATFRAVGAALGAGEAILLFPEGLSQPEPRLMPLRTGAARMLLDAEQAAGGRAGVRLLPVGLVVHEPGTLRAGWALVLFGDAVPTADCLALARTDPEAAVRRLTERLAAALRGRIVEAEDRETLRLLSAAEAIWRQETGASGRDALGRTAWARQAIRAYRYLLASDPSRVAKLRGELVGYAADLDRAGLRGAHLGATYGRGAVSRYAMREGLSLLLGLPLALWGMVAHALPYRLTALASRLARPSPDAEATLKLAAGLVLYPLCWLVEAWAVWRLGGVRFLAVFLVTLGPSGLAALTWRERLTRVGREAQGYWRFLRDRDLVTRLRDRRRGLMAELQALADAVPPSVLRDAPEGRLPER